MTKVKIRCRFCGCFATEKQSHSSDGIQAVECCHCKKVYPVLTGKPIALPRAIIAMWANSLKAMEMGKIGR